MYKFEAGFFGVFSPKGELEAVESTQDGADAAAVNLSPGDGPRKTVNRKTAPVLIFCGSLDDFAIAVRDGTIEAHKVVQRTSKVGPQPFKQA